jgi:hypothetical protein
MFHLFKRLIGGGNKVKIKKEFILKKKKKYFLFFFKFQ